MDEREDTGIHDGVGRLLGLFFGLVIFCGISLGSGYWLGRNSVRQPMAVEAAAAPATRTPSALGKPEAGKAAPAKAADCASGDNCPPQAAPANAATPAVPPSDLTFYQAVRQNEPHPQLTPPEAPAGAASPAAGSTLGAGYLVQIAAVRYQDDAKLLGDTLQKQRYPVLITQPGDQLFHVQVGPYADIKEAESIRARLIGAGYNAFLKH